MKKFSSRDQSKKSSIPIYLSLLLISLLVICYFTIPSFSQFFNEAWDVLSSDDEARIEAWVTDFGWFGPFLIVLAMIAQMFLLVIPTLLLMIVSVLAYGPIWGSLISITAVFTASSVGYAIGIYVSSKFISRILGEKTFKKVSSFVRKYGFWAVAITRLNPFLSNDAISFVTGILKMNYWKFVTATFLGIFPVVMLLALIGKNTDSLKSGLLWGSIASVLIFGIYIWWDKQKNKSV